MLQRQPHPVRSIREAMSNRDTVCDPRGYCGPFVNEEFYSSFTDPLWHGMGDCVYCKSTVHTQGEQAKRRPLHASSRE